MAGYLSYHCEHDGSFRVLTSGCLKQFTSSTVIFTCGIGADPKQRLLVKALRSVLHKAGASVHLTIRGIQYSCDLWPKVLKHLAHKSRSVTLVADPSFRGVATLPIVKRLPVRVCVDHTLLLSLWPALVRRGRHRPFRLEVVVINAEMPAFPSRSVRVDELRVVCQHSSRRAVQFVAGLTRSMIPARSGTVLKVDNLDVKLAKHSLHRDWRPCLFEEQEHAWGDFVDSFDI